MAFVVTTSKGGKRSFSSHKSARNFCRQSIIKGADWAFVHLKKDAEDMKEEGILRNVYRAEVDKANNTREYRRVPLEGWTNLMAQEEATRRTSPRK